MVLGRSSTGAEPASAANLQFNPCDDRLVLEYLRPFALGHITAAGFVINDDPYRDEPGVLLAEHQADEAGGAFFLTRKTMVGSRRSRTVAEKGTWRTQASENRPVVDAAGRVVAMFRKTQLSYYEANNRGASTGYVMYEYELFLDGDVSGGMHDCVLCHVKKSCREVARSNKRKRARELQVAAVAAAASSSMHSNSYGAATSLSGFKSRTLVLYPCEAPVMIDCTAANQNSAISLSGQPELRGRAIINQHSVTSLLENSKMRGFSEAACEDPVIIDDTDANPNCAISLSRPSDLRAPIESAGTASAVVSQHFATSLSANPESRDLIQPACDAPVTNIDYTGANPNSAICLSRPPESKAVAESAGKSQNIADGNSSTSLSGTPESRALPESACEAPPVISHTDANPDSVISVSKLPESEALLESACKSPTATNQHSTSSLSELPESRSLHESAYEIPEVANAHSAAFESTPSETQALIESASEAPTAANPDSAAVQSRPPESKAIIESPSEAPTDIGSTDHSLSKLQTISQPTFGSKDAANNSKPATSLDPPPSHTTSEAAETPLENKPRQEEQPSDKSQYNLGELIDMLVTDNPAVAKIFNHPPWNVKVGLFKNIAIKQQQRQRLRIKHDEEAMAPTDYCKVLSDDEVQSLAEEIAGAESFEFLESNRSIFF